MGEKGNSSTQQALPSFGQVPREALPVQPHANPEAAGGSLTCTPCPSGLTQAPEDQAETMALSVWEGKVTREKQENNREIQTGVQKAMAGLFQPPNSTAGGAEDK